MQPSKLVNDLIASVAGHSRPVTDIQIGATWTAVNGKYCGMSKTYGLAQAGLPPDMSRFIGREAVELAQYAHSWNLVEAGIGCASIISMVAPPDNCLEINAQEIVLERAPGSKVVMVGAFPFIRKLKETAKELIVLELEPSLQDVSRGILPATACEYCIPDCDLLVITGSALINRSLERLLELARNSRAYTIILGPSTVMSPVLFDYGADVLAGTYVHNPAGLMSKMRQTTEGLETGAYDDDITFKVIMK